METALLCGFAFLAGLVDSVAGGGGLIQLPAMLLFLPSNVAASLPTVFGTNKLSSIFGTATAVVQYSRRVPIPWPTILPAALVAFAFSFLGARLVTGIDPGVLKPVVLALLVIVAVYTFWRKDLGSHHVPRLPAQREQWIGLAVGAVIGFYDGFFGPGAGSFLIFTFVGVFGFDFLNASASAKVVNFATNLSAVLYFAATGHIAWEFGLPMAACNIAGSLTGTRLAILKGNRFIRALFLAVASVLILRFGWEILRPATP